MGTTGLKEGEVSYMLAQERQASVTESNIAVKVSYILAESIRAEGGYAGAKPKNLPDSKSP